MADTLLYVMSDPGSAGATEPALPRPGLTFELETARARIAAELFGVAVSAPQIGRFHVLEKLGEGGMGEVYAAFDPELDRRVAIKVLHSDHGESQERRERLIREAQALARVSHPNVVQVFEVGLHREHVFVAMEYVRGESLAQWLDHQPDPPDWRVVVDHFIAAGQGLTAVHAAGLVHRDFKPANTIVGADGRTRILDFGLVRATALDDSHELPYPHTPARLEHSLTAMGSVVGTPGYMAPEVFLGQRADARSDQYSFCVALYEGLYGERPHIGATLAALASAKILGDLPRPPSGTKVPAWLHAAVVRGLAPTAAQRWPSMTELIAELGRDRRSALRRWSVTLLALVLLGATGVAIQQVVAHQRIAADERARAETAEREAAAQEEAAQRAAFERAAMAEAETAAEVMRLAGSRGHERDALILGIQAMAPHGPDFAAAPRLVLDGLARALPAMIPSWTIPGRGSSVVGLALSPDGLNLAAVHTGGELTFWQADTGRLTASAPWSGTYADLSFSPDGSTLLISGDRCTVHDANTATRIHELPSCLHGRFSPDGRTIHAMSREKSTITSWDAASGAERWTTPAAPGLEGITLDPSGRTLAAGFADGSVHLLAADDGRRLAALRVPASRPARPPDIPKLTTLVFSHDGALLAAGASGVELFDVADRRHLATLVPPGDDWYINLLFAHDDRTLLTSGMSGLRIFDTRTHELTTLSRTSSLGSPAFLTDGYVLAADNDGKLERWAPEGALVDYVEADESSKNPLPLVVSVDRSRAATGRDEIRLWSLRDPRPLASWWLPGSPENALESGSRMVVARDDELHVHDRQTGHIVARIADTTPVAPDGELHAVYVLEDRLWSRRGDWLRVHDLRDGRLLLRQLRRWPATHWSWITSVGAPRIVLTTPDGAFEIVDVATGATRCRITGEGERMRPSPWLSKVALSRDGRHLAVPAGDHDETALVTGLPGALRVSLWSTDDCTPRTVITLPHEGRAPPPLLELSFAENGSLVTRLGTTTFVHDPATGMQRLRVDDVCSFDDEGVSELSPDGTTLLTICGGHAVLYPLGGEPPTEIDVAIGHDERYYTNQYAEGLRRHFFADSGRILLPDPSGDLLVWNIATAAPDIRLSTRGSSLFRATVSADGEHIQHQDHRNQFTTYAVTRRSVMAAACQALVTTEVADQVATECAALSR
ncbi:MAG: protein kinase [Nannocystis sp.]|uniref:WD40 repeat domain-containing serine/threonine protein kinase n=1 Tax=Nannocystis sp. TaxID=1962667 RepID=UPI002422D97C|nr:WD40 repeat domain-containing serine/threonine protein kinase [Nannocystis sp.]MBK9752018.1 protein kinase [Nannocystis sp.]